MDMPENLPPEVEGQYHTFVTHRIPWWVHLIWITYWLFAIGYVVVYQFPVIGPELLDPP